MYDFVDTFRKIFQGNQKQKQDYIEAYFLVRCKQLYRIMMTVPDRGGPSKAKC